MVKTSSHIWTSFRAEGSESDTEIFLLTAVFKKLLSHLTSAMTLPLLLIVFLLPGEPSSFFLQKQMLKKQLQLFKGICQSCVYGSLQRLMR